jgi:hypothetical protein
MGHHNNCHVILVINNMQDVYYCTFCCITWHYSNTMYKVQILSRIFIAHKQTHKHTVIFCTWYLLKHHIPDKHFHSYRFKNYHILYLKKMSYNVTKMGTTMFLLFLQIHNKWNAETLLKTMHHSLTESIHTI